MLKRDVKQRFGYEPHEWRLQAAVKVLEGNDGIVVAGTGKWKAMVLQVAVAESIPRPLSPSENHCLILTSLPPRSKSPLHVNSSYRTAKSPLTYNHL